MSYVTNQCNESGNDRGVGEIFFLGNLRHDEVIPDQPDDQFGVFLG